MKGNKKAARPAMSADEARSFEHFSNANAAQLMEAATVKGCHCAPYDDWFTYRRWQAQGMQVQKGEHGEKLTILIRVETKDEGGAVTDVQTRPWHTTVFCRCQVKPQAEPDPSPAPSGVAELVRPAWAAH
jgi:antirestriction protein ArdC